MRRDDTDTSLIVSGTLVVDVSLLHSVVLVLVLECPGDVGACAAPCGLMVCPHASCRCVIGPMVGSLHVDARAPMIVMMMMTMMKPCCKCCGLPMPMILSSTVIILTFF